MTNLDQQEQLGQQEPLVKETSVKKPLVKQTLVEHGGTDFGGVKGAVATATTGAGGAGGDGNLRTSKGIPNFHWLFWELPSPK